MGEPTAFVEGCPVLLAPSPAQTGFCGDLHLQDDEAHVWHLVDGLATEFWGCPKDPYEADAFWS
jgi:hypothetical protein